MPFVGVMAAGVLAYFGLGETELLLDVTNLLVADHAHKTALNELRSNLGGSGDGSHKG